MEAEEAVIANSSLDSDNVSDVRQIFNFTSSWDWATMVETGSVTSFTLLGVTVSGLVFVMYRNKRSLRTSANTYVLSLTISNFLRSVFLLPSYATFFKRWMPGEVSCHIFSFLNIYMNLVSVLSILLIAFDRNCAVNDPLNYIRNNSKAKAGAFAFCVWFASMLVLLPILFGFPELDYDTCDIKVSSTGSILDPGVIYESGITFIAFILPLFSVASLYYGMYKAARNSCARDERNSCSSCLSSDMVLNMKSPGSSGDSECSLRRHYYVRDDENSHQKNRFLKKHRAAVTGLLVVVSFIICWSPYFIARLYQHFKSLTIQFRFWVHFHTFLSSIVDPYVYFYRNRSTWNYTKKMASQILYRKKSVTHLRNNINIRMSTIGNLYNIPSSSSHTIMASQLVENGNFRQILKTAENCKVQIALYDQYSLIISQNKNNIQTEVTKKQFVHQDSNSSNSSSDVCPTVLSSDSGEIIRYQSLKQKLSDESSSAEEH